METLLTSSVERREAPPTGPAESRPAFGGGQTDTRQSSQAAQSIALPQDVCVCACFRWCRCGLCVRNCSGYYLEGNSRFLPHVCISLSQDSTLYTTTLTLRYTNAPNLHGCTEYMICHSALLLYMCVQPLWRAAVSQFDRLIAPAEQEAAGKLKTFIIDAQDSPQQVHKHTLVLCVQMLDFLSISQLILAKSCPLRQEETF